jgi:hypothetical protein
MLLAVLFLGNSIGERWISICYASRKKTRRIEIGRRG